jgi:hypothetical protein
MTDVLIETYALTVTAFDSLTKSEIESSTFDAVSRDGNGPRTDPMPMYDSKKPITHFIGVNPADPATKIWRLRAQNVDPKGGPAFACEYSCDVTTTPVVRFVLSPHKAQSG